MNAADERSAAERREDLRARLRAQRQDIAGRLGYTEGQEGSYPRSATMRLLTRRPELVARALGLAFSVFRSRSAR